LGKKGGGGGGGSGAIQIPSALNSSGGASLLQNVFNPLGTYGSEMMGGLGSLANWAANIATGGNVLGAQGTLPQNGLLAGGTGKVFSPFTNASDSSTLGPFLSQAQQGLTGMEASTITGQNLLNTGVNQAAADQTQANWLTHKGNVMLSQATNGPGLFPSQQAQITQAEQSQQAAVQQQLANEGLGGSSVNAQLQGQVKMSAAAAAGQLVQGNISAANQTVGLGQTATALQQEQQKIDLAAQQALYGQFAGIASQSASIQAQMWSEAQQGYGTLGQMMNSTLAAFGYSMKTQEDVLQANETTAQIQAGIATSQAQMAQQGASSMFGALGSLLGQGGSGGGLLGGLIGTTGSGIATGSLGAGIVGQVGATAGTGILGGLGGALGGIGSGIGAAVSALAASSCTAGRGVKGVTDIRWVLFRDWILYRAPSLIRSLYVGHSESINDILVRYPWAREVILFLVDQVVEHDQNTRTA
jgi:hypothetical protein